MAIQPRGLRLEVGFKHGSASIIRTPLSVRMSSGRRARTFADIYFAASWTVGIGRVLVEIAGAVDDVGSVCAGPCASAVPAGSMARIQMGEKTPIRSMSTAIGQRG